jgi:hypothetical protein
VVSRRHLGARTRSPRRDRAQPEDPRVLIPSSAAPALFSGMVPILAPEM